MRRLLRRPLVLVLLVVLPGALLLYALARGGAAVIPRVVAALRAAFGRGPTFRQVRDEFLRQLAELRPDLTADAQVRAAGVVGAQAVLETGGGVAVAWREGWNFGNVRKGSWTGPVVYGGDKKPDGKGGYVAESGVAFRRYETLAEAVSDFIRLLGWPRYRAARERLFAGDADGYVRALRDDDPRTSQLEGGYFTAPLAEYQAGVAAALRSYA